MALLDDEAVRTALEGLTDWAGDTSAISRTVEAADFMTGIRLVADVAAEAEAVNHHPDIDIRWRNVTFRLSTHSEGGVTEADVRLAHVIDELATRHAPSE